MPLRESMVVRAVDVCSDRGSWVSCRRRFVRGLLAAVVVASILIVFGGCSAGFGGTSSSRAALLSTLENWSALMTPVDQARGVLTQECMARHGLPYYPFAQAGQPGGEPLFAAGAFGSSLWLGPQSLVWRSVNGWGLYEQTMARLGQPGGFFGAPPQQLEVFRSLRGANLPRYFKALYGGGKTTRVKIPGLPGETFQVGGCDATAGKQLFGSIAASVAVPQYGPSLLNGTIQGSAGRSPAVRAGQARWAACVRARTGVVAPSPSRLFLHFFTLYNTQGPTPAVHGEEIAAAVADLSCQRLARLPQAVQSAALAAIGRLPDSVLGELQALVAVLDQARSKAQAVFAHPVAPAPLTTTQPTVAPAPAPSVGPPILGGPGVLSAPRSVGTSSRVVVVGGG